MNRMNLNVQDARPLPIFTYSRSRLFHADCFDWLEEQSENSVHAVVTDPPYSIVEYSAGEQKKLRNGKGGVWRIPPSFDGYKRSPLPRFTTLTSRNLAEMYDFFRQWATSVLPVIVPGGHMMIASNPLVVHIVSSAVVDAGFESRGNVIRQVMTLRGGDRPKNAHEEFSDVSVMPRSMWEPWVLARKPLDGRVQDNLRNWSTGGLRRVSDEKPFGDLIMSHPTRAAERKLAQHPSLKPQSLMRQLVRAVLPLGEGIVLDPFAGAGSTLAAAAAIGYQCIGVEKDSHYIDIAVDGIPKLALLESQSK